MPLQPAFLAKPASEQTNIATDSSFITIVLGNEIFDQNADFASNTFTAPVTGKYQFNLAIRLQNIDAASVFYLYGITTSNRVIHYLFDPDAFDADVPYFSPNVSVLLDMDAGDTAIAIIRQNGGTAQTDIGEETSFSGFLAC